MNYETIIYQKADNIARITLNRPEVLNAINRQVMAELLRAIGEASRDNDVRVLVLTGAERAFCAGGDQRIRGHAGYKDGAGSEHLNVLQFQRQIRRCQKVVIAMVAGYAIGGGHVLHIICDLTIAADNAIFGQTGPMVGRLRVNIRGCGLYRKIYQRV